MSRPDDTGNMDKNRYRIEKQIYIINNNFLFYFLKSNNLFNHILNINKKKYLYISNSYNIRKNSYCIVINYNLYIKLDSIIYTYNNKK